MGKGIKEDARARELEPVSLSELIHQHVRLAIETAVHEELRAALGTSAPKSDVATATASGNGHSRDRPARLRSRFRGPPCSEAPARKSGPRRSSRAISGECRRSMKRWSPRTWQAATPDGFAARSNRRSRPARPP